MSKAVVSISGTVGKDCVIKELPNGGVMCSFSAASNSRQKGKDGEWSDLTTWFDVTIFGRNAEYLRGQFFKGAKCFVSGELVNAVWTDREGIARSSLRVTASHAEGLTKADAQRKEAPPAAAPDFNDDIPF